MTSARTLPPAADNANGARLLPLLYGSEHALGLLGPTPEEAPLAVEPFTSIDRPHGERRALLGGLCDEAQRLIELVELIVSNPLPGAPSAAVSEPAPAGDVHSHPEPPDGVAAATAMCRRLGVLPVLLYCRKRNVLFAAYGANREPLGPVTSAEAAISAQKEFLDTLGDAPPPELSTRHPCITCPERPRCYPSGSGFAYAAERLALVNARPQNGAARPLGEWQLSEAAAWIGGCEVSALRNSALGAVDEWRRGRLAQLGSERPRRLLPSGEDGRALVEIVRLKLGLIAGALAQLEAGWAATGRPHLCWTADTIRVAARPPLQTRAAAWGLLPILRKTGWQGMWHPAAQAVGHESATDFPRPEPPVFTDADLLSPAVLEAGRFFGQPRAAQVYVKTSQPEAGGTLVALLIEELGWPRRLFVPADLLELAGEGWTAWVAPCAEHDPNDGAGLAVTGRAHGECSALSPGATLSGVRVNWWARFGEAVDLAALGLLTLETLLVNDAHPASEWRAGLRSALDQLEVATLAEEPERRGAAARQWLGQRCQDDAPASLWTRRNVLYRAAERSTARLEALPPGLWQATLGLAVRMATFIPGYSLCASRAEPAPRWGGHSLALAELHGLIAAYDDLLLGRRPPLDSNQ